MAEHNRSLRFLNKGGSVYNAVNRGQIALNVAGKYVHNRQRDFVVDAVKIQSILKQLEQNRPMASEAEAVAYVSDETSYSFKRRVLGSLKSGSDISEFLECFERPYVHFGKAILDNWMKSGDM